MLISEVKGVKITYAQKRINFRTGFHAKNETTSGTGATLMHIIDGSAIFDTGKTKFTAGPDDWVFWNTDEMAGYMNSPGKPYSFHLIRFFSLFFEDKVSSDQLSIIPHFKLSPNDKAVSLIDELIRTFRSNETCSNIKSSRLCMELLENIHRYQIANSVNSVVKEMNLDKRMYATLLYINNNFKKRLLVSDLAKLVSMHPVHFTRLFIKTTGISPHNYVLEKKIEKAKDFITFLGDNPDSTSLELGFHDYSHFYRTFKRIVGVSPSAYVKAYKNR